jgi:NitT/TauT family transport system ATP-binding protein
VQLVRAHDQAAAYVEDPANRDDVASVLAAPNRLNVQPEVIRRTLDGDLKIAPDGTVRHDDRYLLVGRAGAARPDPAQAAWLYAQMVRWGQVPLSRELLAAAKAVFRDDLFDAALNGTAKKRAAGSEEDVGAFAGPMFDPDNIAAHLAAWDIKHPMER